MDGAIGRPIQYNSIEIVVQQLAGDAAEVLEGAQAASTETVNSRNMARDQPSVIMKAYKRRLQRAQSSRWRP